MKKWIIAALVVAVAAAFINDLGRYFTVLYNLDLQTREVAAAAATTSRGTANPTAGWPAASSVAQKYGIEVTAYGQAEQLVTVETRAPVPGTWVFGPVAAVLRGKPWNTPPTASARAETYYR